MAELLCTGHYREYPRGYVIVRSAQSYLCTKRKTFWARHLYCVNDSVGLGAKKFRGAWSMGPGLLGIIGIAMFSVYTITKR